MIQENEKPFIKNFTVFLATTVKGANFHGFLISRKQSISILFSTFDRSGIYKPSTYNP